MATSASSIAVQVKFMGDLPAVVGQRKVSLTLEEGDTVGDLLACLSKRYGDAFTDRVFSGPAKLQHTMVLFVDGEDIKKLGGFAATLGKGEVEVVMLPMFGGG